MKVRVWVCLCMYVCERDTEILRERVSERFRERV